MQHALNRRPAWAFGVIGLMGLAGCCSPDKVSRLDPAPLVSKAPCPADGNAGAGERRTGSQLWDICVYKRTGEAIDSSAGYLSLNLSADPGDSPINKVSDVGAWRRAWGYIDRDIQSAVVTLKLGDSVSIGANPAIPVIALARASNGDLPPRAAIPDGQQLMRYTLADDTARWGLEIDYKFGVDNQDHIASGIVSLGQKVLAVYPVGGVVGAMVPKISDEDRKQLDKFVGSLRSYRLAPPPSQLSFSPKQWREIDHLSVVFYDKPVGEPDRRTVVTLRISPDYLASVYTQKLSDGMPDYSQYKTGASYGKYIGALAGTTEKVFGDLSNEMANQIKTNDASVFARVCNDAPARFASAHLEADTDAILATWLVLMNSPARTVRAPSGMCDASFEARMNDLKLAKFPYQLAPDDMNPAQRQKNLIQTTQNMNNLSAALVTASPNLDAHFADTVVVKQDRPVLPEVKSGEAQVLTATELAANLKAANAQSMHGYRYSGVASSVAPAKLKIDGKDVPVLVEWSGVGDTAKVTAIRIEPK
ncbi:hypothetical protein RA280_22715 [Cupriavidus sp. CV2]|uniref:hypothetical protein n=1 Tax=Cupriavidus ulmosensis TaxID=3065913 RepID=UPI00296B0700|nr:hypothetical protein [Cupriavidus sp. CV2]MDW3684507.1 hypothetical protein [Cupriavidus sp. CV2]